MEIMLNRKDIDEFKEIYQQEFGIEIDDPTALKLGANLLTLIRAIHQPIPLTGPNTKLEKEYEQQ